MPTIDIPTINISKTTLNGYLTVGLIVCGLLTRAPHVPIWLSSGAGTVLGILRIINGHLQQDAGSQPAFILGQLGVQDMPSHEIPNNPAAIPVTK
jgi:hypothetical protein